MIKQFYYKESKVTPLIVGDTLNLGPMPLIWNLNGLYRIISTQQVENRIELIRDHKNIPILNKFEVDLFNWDEGIDLDPKIVRLLIGK